MSNFPEWAKVGEKVLQVNYRYGVRTATEVTITRLTKTRIITSNSYGHEVAFVQAKYRENEWEVYGTRDRWHSPDTLLYPDSAEGSKLVKELLHNAKLQKARTACVDFSKQQTEEAALDALKALQTYLESEQRL